MGDLGSWGSGGTPLASETKYSGGEIPWLIIEDLNDGIVSRSIRKITPLGLENSSAKMVPRGTLLIAMYGSIGKLGITEISCATNQAIAFCKCDPKKVDTKFLFFQLLQERARLLQAGRGGTQQNISQEFLRDYEINLPELSDQKRIAGLLEQADRLRRTRRYALELSKTFLPAALIEIFGDPAANPKGFPRATIDAACAKIIDYRGRTPAYAEHGIAHVTAACIKEGEIRWRDAKRVSEQTFTEYMTRGLPQLGDVLLTTEAPLGETAVVRTRERFSLAQRLILLRPSSRLMPDYLCHLLGHVRFRSQLLRFATGSTVKGISSENLQGIPLPIPPLKSQEQFAAVVERYESIRAVQREALRQTDHLFQSLLDQAFAA